MDIVYRIAQMLLFVSILITHIPTAIGGSTDGITVDIAPVLATKNFCWLIEGIAAGMAQPKKDIETVEALAEANIGAIVSLNGDTWEGADKKLLDLHEIEHHSFSLPDPFLYSTETLPLFQQIIKVLIQLSNRMYALNKGLVVHCEFGIHRTWCILGCLLLVHYSALDTFEQSKKAQARSDIMEAIKSLSKYPNAAFLQALLKKDASQFLEEMIALRNTGIVEQVTMQFFPPPASTPPTTRIRNTPLWPNVL